MLVNPRQNAAATRLAPRLTRGGCLTLPRTFTRPPQYCSAQELLRLNIVRIDGYEQFLSWKMRAIVSGGDGHNPVGELLCKYETSLLRSVKRHGQST